MSLAFQGPGAGRAPWNSEESGLGHVDEGRAGVASTY